MKVRDAMTERVITARPDTTLEEIASMMKSQDTGAIPVVDEGELMGIVTDRDIVVRCIADGGDPSDTTAEEIVSEELETIDPESDLDEAIELMSQKQIRRLPVVDNGELVGMLSIGDVAVKQGDQEESGRALKEVSQGVKNSRVARPEPLRREDVSTRNATAKGGRGGQQGIANRDLDEEVKRQKQVVSIRPEENQVPRGQKKSGKEKAS
ncbi:MAG TPA: CBS domain-containing protein [Terriglobales bacterium]|nr:CBS domain-containing protein [Terriglobales bacterium]